MTDPTNPLDPRDPTQILRDRARALAREEPRVSSERTVEVLEFALANERWAVETRWVGAVCPLEDLTPLPGLPAFFRGVVSVRGRIVPAFDLERFLDLPDRGLTDLHGIVLIQGNGMELGLLVQAPIGVRAIARGSLQPSSSTLLGARGEYFQGVTVEPLAVLDAARILADRRIIVHDEAGEP